MRKRLDKQLRIWLGKQRGNPQGLMEWYESGGGADEIDWGTEGAMQRCHDKASEYLDDDAAWGFCTNRRMAVGAPVAKLGRSYDPFGRLLNE